MLDQAPPPVSTERPRVMFLSAASAGIALVMGRVPSLGMLRCCRFYPTSPAEARVSAITHLDGQEIVRQPTRHGRREGAGAVHVCLLA